MFYREFDKALAAGVNIVAFIVFLLSPFFVVIHIVIVIFAVIIVMIIILR